MIQFALSGVCLSVGVIKSFARLEFTSREKEEKQIERNFKAAPIASAGSVEAGGEERCMAAHRQTKHAQRHK